MRGIETVSPKTLKHSMKAIRFAQGVQNLKGHPVIDEVLLLQAFCTSDFTPAKVSAQCAINNKRKPTKNTTRV